MDLDILVVGAGPTGLTLAEELARFGVSFRIIDAGRGPTDLSKAIGVQARTLETLDIIGIADELVRHGNPAKGFRIYDGKDEILKLDFTRLGSRFPFLLTVPQRDTEHVLLEKLNARQHVERETTLIDFTQDSSGVDATLRHGDGGLEQVRARWLVGCDGAHSKVREKLGLPFEGKDYEESFLLADVHVEWSLPDDELYLFLHDGWLAAFFALPGGRCRLIADLPPEQAPKDQQPSLEVCQRIVAERVPMPATLSDPNWTAYYRIHRRIVPRLQQERVFLAGDAAHIHSPAAAQGMNTGIQDAFNLAWKLALVAHGQAPDSLLESYNAERYPVESAVLKNTDLLLSLASVRQPVARKLRDLLLPHLSANWVSITTTARPCWIATTKALTPACARPTGRSRAITANRSGSMSCCAKASSCCWRLLLPTIRMLVRASSRWSISRPLLAHYSPLRKSI
jgi:2-polyprenyl-6-methoxyphenol hydroxylase-like FAD-dependent oxidoreductase